MSEQSPENSDGNAVEECPAPPRYYKLFSTVKIAPPILPDITNVTAWSSDHQYNGAISALMTNQDVANVPNELYKAEMQRLVRDDVANGPSIDLKAPMSSNYLTPLSYFLPKSALLGIMTTGLSMVTDGCSYRREYQIEVRVAPLNQAIQKMQSVLSAYQLHEARELLCLDMARQVQRLKELKLEMTNLLNAANIDEKIAKVD